MLGPPYPVGRALEIARFKVPRDGDAMRRTGRRARAEARSRAEVTVRTARRARRLSQAGGDRVGDPIDEANGYALRRPLAAAPVADLVDTAPEIGQRLRERMRDVESTASSLSEVGEQIDEIAGADDDAQVVTIKQPGLVSSATSTLATGLTSLAVALVLALFMLGTGDLFYE